MLFLTITLLSTLTISGVGADTDADVLILGAGLAGQTAAAYFKKMNVSYLLIEGAGEPGGRLKSKMFGGRMVETGPIGIFAMNSTIQAMVDMYNITGMYANYESVIVRTPENMEPEAEAEASWDKLAEAQKKVKELYMKIKDGKIHDMSARVALEYGNWFPKTPVDDVIEVFDYDYEFAKIPETISTDGFLSANPYQEMPFLSNDQRGLQNILEKIARDDSQLKLNEIVTNISDTGSSVSVKTKSGKTFTGKYVIVTFSMGVLKSGSVTFEPALPDWKLFTVYKTSMDFYTQIYVTFPAGTPTNWITNQFVLFASPRRGYYPIIWNLEADNFAPQGKPMISFHVMGEEARRIDRINNDTVIMGEIKDVLKKMFGPATPEPDEILVTRWSQDPLAMGSFSSRQVGDNSPMFLDALKSPVGRIYFAGDAYNDVVDGFLIGAFMSGNSTAMKVYDCMMNNKCHKFNPDSYKPVPPKPTTCGTTSVSVTSFLLLIASTVITHL